jgi:hypothetical protein
LHIAGCGGGISFIILKVTTELTRDIYLKNQSLVGSCRIMVDFCPALM